MKRKEKLSVETKDFPNVVRLLAFINVNIDDVAFPAFQELDVKSCDVIVISDDNDTLL